MMLANGRVAPDAAQPAGAHSSEFLCRFQGQGLRFLTAPAVEPVGNIFQVCLYRLIRVCLTYFKLATNEKPILSVQS